MTVQSREVDDFYKGGRFLRRWSLVNGHARCLEDAYARDDVPFDIIQDQLAKNAKIRSALAAVEPYEAALLVLNGPPPEQTGRHDEWVNAQDVVSRAPDEVRQMAKDREKGWQV